MRGGHVYNGRKEDVEQKGRERAPTLDEGLVPQRITPSTPVADWPITVLKAGVGKMRCPLVVFEYIDYTESGKNRYS